MFIHPLNWANARCQAQVTECSAHRRLMLEAAVSKSIDERVRLIEEFIVDTTLGRLYPVDIVEECRSIMKPPQNFNLYVVAGQAFD